MGTRFLHRQCVADGVAVVAFLARALGDCVAESLHAA